MAAKMSGLRIDTGVIDSLDFYDTTPTPSPTERKASDVFQASPVRTPPAESPTSVTSHCEHEPGIGEKRNFHAIIKPGDTLKTISEKLKLLPNLKSLHILDVDGYSNKDIARLAAVIKALQINEGELPLFCQLVIEGPFSNDPVNGISYDGIVKAFENCPIKDLVISNCDLRQVYAHTDFPHVENFNISTYEPLGVLQDLNPSKLRLPNLKTLWAINYCLVGSLNPQVTDLLVVGECNLGLPFSVKKLALLNRGEFDFHGFFKMLAQNPQLEYVQLDVDIALCRLYIFDYLRSGSPVWVGLVKNKSHSTKKGTTALKTIAWIAGQEVVALGIEDMKDPVALFYKKLKLKGYAQPTVASAPVKRPVIKPKPQHVKQQPIFRVPNHKPCARALLSKAPEGPNLSSYEISLDDPEITRRIHQERNLGKTKVNLSEILEKNRKFNNLAAAIACFPNMETLIFNTSDKTKLSDDFLVDFGQALKASEARKDWKMSKIQMEVFIHDKNDEEDFSEEILTFDGISVAFGQIEVDYIVISNKNPQTDYSKAYLAFKHVTQINLSASKRAYISPQFFDANPQLTSLTLDNFRVGPGEFLQPLEGLEIKGECFAILPKKMKNLKLLNHDQKPNPQFFRQLGNIDCTILWLDMALRYVDLEGLVETVQNRDMRIVLWDNPFSRFQEKQRVKALQEMLHAKQSRLTIEYIEQNHIHSQHTFASRSKTSFSFLQQ